MNKFLLIIFAFLLFNCKSKPIEIVKENQVIDKNSTIALEKINKRSIDFKTLSIKTNVKFEDETQSQRVNVDLKIKKNEIIWVNVKLLGIPLARAYITPDKVQFYEKLNNTYFEGDYSVISNLLGTELNFDKIQNMILGFPLEKLESNKMKFNIEDPLFVFTANENNISKTFGFNNQNYLLKKQYLVHDLKKAGINIDYESHQIIDTFSFPEMIKILAMRSKGNANFEIKYNSITINEELNYIYSVPNGYKLRTF